MTQHRSTNRLAGYQAKPLGQSVDTALKHMRCEKDRDYACRALIRAIALGNIDRVNAALDMGAAVTDADALSNTPLHQAAQDGETEILQILIRHTISLDIKNAKGLTPLCLAACGNHAKIIEMLAKVGANVDFATSDVRETPLMMAAYRNHGKAVKALLKHGAKVDAQDVNGVTAFMRAAGQNQIDALKALANGGADPTLTSNSKRTAAEFAKRTKAQKALDFIAAYEAEFAETSIADIA
jgi:ankyrin repeat protein